MQVYSLISSLKTYHPTLHLTPWSLNLFIRVPFQLHGEHTVLQPFRLIEVIVHIAISVLPGTRLMSYLQGVLLTAVVVDVIGYLVYRVILDNFE